MLLSRFVLASLIATGMLAGPVFAASTTRTASTHRSTTAATAHSPVHRSASAHRTTRGRTSTAHARRVSHRIHGQQSIDAERATQIQQALIREHYLTGEPSGQWDEATIAAMQKYQADQGWQTKLMPDSRALKKLGLGPDYSNALNAKGSTFADPPPASTIPSNQNTGFAIASGVN